MPDGLLTEHLAEERSAAVRALLAHPLLDVTADPDGFRLCVRHADWLDAYFDQTCGWTVTVDIASGFARLAKRPVAVDVSRPLTRSRGSGAAFDRRRYEVLCLVCAELVRHPVTTIGLLAGAVAPVAGLVTSRHGERAALVDALRTLSEWGAVRITAGEVDAFLTSEGANAILTADTARLHRLLVSAAAPSAISEEAEVEEGIERLLAEPRYADVVESSGSSEPVSVGDEARNRRVRHRLGRRLLDDPVVYFEDLSEAEREYLTNPSGRRWVRERVAEAGLELEERAEGLMAVDPGATATDRTFPAPLGNAHQLALLLIDRLAPVGLDERRHLGRLTASELRAEVATIFARFPAWARGQREAEGPDRLAEQAVDLLVSFGLARRDPDGSVVARPAAARYRIGEPIVRRDPTLFEEEP